MFQAVLHLRAAKQPQRPAAAWFIPGDDPRVWLAEMAAWRIPLDNVRLCLLPQPARQRQACGVLVVPPPATAPHITLRSEAYGVCSSRLYLPVLARLDPPVSDAEIESVVLNDIAVWHPIAGLVGFDEADLLDLGDLLAAPAERACEWNLARSGAAPPPRLTVVLPPSPPGFEESLADWRDDIGSQAADGFPRVSRVPSNSRLAKLARKAAAGAAGLAAATFGAAGLAAAGLGVAALDVAALAVAGLAAAGLGAGASAFATGVVRAPAWARKLMSKINRTTQRLTSSLAAARRKEIDRLLSLLDKDPDRGLRHALPLKDCGNRWAGPPGTRLPAGDVSFRLGRLAGGRAVDPWQIEQEQRRALERRYRELANREVQLGRHRRAAYIFAELLGDFAAAASALEQGGHDREAAALYRERLGRPLDAARCLERCGSWEIAIEIYSEQQAFEKGAELLERLDRPSEAAGMYRRAAEQWMAQGDRLRAATLLEEKLAAIDEAIELLAAAWPVAAQPGVCLGELFKLFGRHARHEQAIGTIARLREEQGPRMQTGRAVTVLADAARTYPEAAARHQAAEAVRVLAGRRLPDAEADEAAVLVRAVRSLVPQDALLGRDAARWLARMHKSHLPAKAQFQASHRQVKIVETGSFRLPGDVTYKAVVSFNVAVMAAGFTADGVAAVWADFDGDVMRGDWKRPLAEMQPLLLAADDQAKVKVIAAIGGRPFEPQLGLDTPAWFTPETLAVAVSSLGVVWTIDSQLLLTAFQGEALQLSSRQFSLAEMGVRIEPREEPPERLAVMLARGDEVYLGIGHSLIKVKNDRVAETTLRGWVRQLAAAPLVLQLRLAAGFENYGAAVIWDDLNGHEVVNIADGLERPELTFTLDGLLIAADERELHVYSTSNRSVSLRSRLAGPRRPLAGLICGQRPGEFAMLTADGMLRRYRIE